jgi:hypothetical protein
MTTSSHASDVAIDQNKEIKKSWNNITPLEDNLNQCTALIHGIKSNQSYTTLIHLEP